MVFVVGCQQTPDNPNRSESLKILDAKIKKHPKKAELYYQRGNLLLDMGKEQNDNEAIREAILDLNKAIKLDDDEAKYYIALGDAYFSQGNAGSSYAALQKAQSLEPDNFEAALKMGEITFYSGDYDRAMESLSKVTEIDKNNQTALFMKGFIYKETGDTANATYYFRKVINIYPDYAPAYEELGMVYLPYNPKLAMDYLNTAHSLDPQNINILYGMAMIYQDAEEADLANDMYVKILEIDPNYKYAWFNRGWMALILYEDYPSAIDFFTKAIDCDPQYAEAHYNRGLAYEMMGDKAKAKACYEAAHEIDPSLGK